VYGPRQRPEMAIHKFTRLLYEGNSIPMYGDGSTARDYTYIDDIIAGVLASLDRPFPFEILNLGESVTVTLRSLIDTLEQVSGRKPKTEQLSLQPGDVTITYADVSKARRLLDYTPTTSIESGLSRFLAWFEKTRH
jgi:UDP-glucuronate 4-epimerase